MNKCQNISPTQLLSNAFGPQKPTNIPITGIKNIQNTV